MCAKHNSLEAVDLMTVVIRALAERGMTVNMISEFYHGHLFVLGGRVEEAVTVLDKAAVKHGEG